ncbi:MULTISPECIES: hypothetical protein [Streptomyces]|uniref:hypothetical protein n=1 Tax=Streptomyces TaxID=1883 RepID=UPI00068C5B61|nr:MULTISPECIES: hypothetical protein [Streptomyces]
MISKLAMLAKRTIEAAWLNGSSYDLATQAAEALESAQLLQSPETAAELAALRERLTAAPAALPAEQRAAIAELVGDAKPATDRLLEQLAESVRDRREHKHPTWEDLFCLNLVSWAGERMGPVLRRLLDAEARVAELEAQAGTNYSARWDSVPLGQYTNQAAAREHCEDHACRDLPTATFDWIEDEEDGVAELVATVNGSEGPTGYTVTTLEIASKYDPEADE